MVTAKTCRHAPNSMQCFIHLKSQFQEKIPVLPNTEISVSCAIPEHDNIRITTPHYPVFLLSVKWSLTGVWNKRKFQTCSSKSSRSRLRRGCRLQGIPKNTYSDLTWKRLVLWKTARWREVVAVGGLTLDVVHRPLLKEPFAIRAPPRLPTR